MKKTILNLTELRHPGGEAVDKETLQRAVRAWLTARLSLPAEEGASPAPGPRGGGDADGPGPREV